MPKFPNLELKEFQLESKDYDLDKWLQSCTEETHWVEGHIKLFGKIHKIPRLQSWYADKGIQYSYSGKSLKRNDWNNSLSEIKNAIEELSNKNFNSVLMNLYRNGNDSMGLHSDDEKELGEFPVIASLSLGAPRKIFFKHKFKKINFNINQNHGTVLVMSGETQKYWKHEIKKEKKIVLPRVNLTFRNIIS